MRGEIPVQREHHAAPGAGLLRVAQVGARCRVVLSLDGDFAPHLVETLLTFGESTTAGLAAGAAAA